MAEQRFTKEPAPGKWIQPGTDSKTIGRQIIGNAYRDYLERNGMTDDATAQRQQAREDFKARRYGTTDALEDAYQAAQERKANAWKDDAQAQRDAARHEFLAKRYGTTDSIEDAYQAAQERKQNAWRDDAQSQAARDKARNDFLDKRYGGGK
ncbi:hypothetical protein BTW10_13050 [Chromohalobacter japonicus]|uniref:Uncharacterized protein n=1 Tax=Chromohalobacter japonicus TaxID=223900 RepID=A0A1Q8TAI1_9GAMM|nr:hypothetical protein [Chromohalobacter japonicus]OLO10628.1 hypothetical protein BTW10_13050 [Chromohalobacter japonicus]